MILIALRKDLEMPRSNPLLHEGLAIKSQLQRQHQDILQAISSAGMQNCSSEILSAKLSASVELLTQERFNIAMLSLLSFVDMEDRHERIPKAHQNTFHWIFRTPDPTTQSKPGDKNYTEFAPWPMGTGPGNLY
jgi:hypothetical protein